MHDAVSTLLEAASLPCPTPLQTAVDARMFGVRRDGTFQPSPEEVASITLKHARGMLRLWCDSQHLERCHKYDIHPQSGKPLRGPRLEKRRSAIEHEATTLRLYYYRRREAYANAFGWDAAKTLDECLQSLYQEAESSSGDMRMQQRLF